MTTHQSLVRNPPDELLISIENIEDAVSIAASYTTKERKPLLRRSKNDNLVIGRNSFQQVEEEGADVGGHLKPVVFVEDLR